MAGLAPSGASARRTQTRADSAADHARCTSSKRRMSHGQRCTGSWHAGDLAKIGGGRRERVEVLEDESGEDRARARIRQRNHRAGHLLERDRRSGDALPCVGQHAVRDVERPGPLERGREVLGEAAGAAADLDARGAIEAVPLPAGQIHPPVGRAAGIELLVRPRRRAAPLFAWPGRDRPERVDPAPPFPVAIRAHRRSIFEWAGAARNS